MRILSILLVFTMAGALPPAYAEEAPQTLESLRRDLARDFPPESGTTASVEEVVIRPDGSVRAPGLAESELAFLARVFKNLEYGPERRVRMVTLRFSKPKPYAVRSFVEADAQGRIRIIPDLKIIENADGKITTISPFFRHPKP